MKIKNLCKIVLTVAAMFTVATTANAQLNLGALKNKVTNKVKDEVTNAANKAVDKAVDNAKQQATTTVNNAVNDAVGNVTSNTNVPDQVSSVIPGIPGAKKEYDPFATYKPSAAAIAADPAASDETVEKNFTKSKAAIRGAWENLPEDLFPFKPYYEYYDDMLFSKDEQTRDNLGVQYVVISNILASQRNTMDKRNIPTFFNAVKEKGKVRPQGEHVLYAFFADFFADPNSYVGYREMIKASRISEALFYGGLYVDVVPGTKTGVKMGDGEVVTLCEDEPARVSRWRDVQLTAKQLALQSDYENVFISTYTIYNSFMKAYKAGDMDDAALFINELRLSYEILKDHPGFKKDERANQMTAFYNEAWALRGEVEEAAYQATQPAVDMPKTYNVSADIVAKAKATIAKYHPELSSGKLYFLSDSWRQLKDSRTQVVNFRAMNIGIVTEEKNGEKMLHEFLFMQEAQVTLTNIVYLDNYILRGGSRTKVK